METKKEKDQQPQLQEETIVHRKGMRRNDRNDPDNDLSKDGQIQTGRHDSVWS